MAVRHEGPGHLHTAGPHAPTRASTRGHDIFRPPAFASRSSYSRRGVGPSSRSAYRPKRPDLDGVTAFRTHELRPGWVPPIPRGRVVLTRPGRLPGRRPPLPSGQSLHPATTSHQRGSRFTRHQRGFTHVHPSGLPLARGRPGWNGRPFGFPPGFAPRRSAGNARQGRGQAIEHGPGTTAQLTSVDLQSGSSLNACDLASHGEREVYAPGAGRDSHSLSHGHHARDVTAG